MRDTVRFGSMCGPEFCLMKIGQSVTARFGRSAAEGADHRACPLVSPDVGSPFVRDPTDEESTCRSAAEQDLESLASVAAPFGGGGEDRGDSCGGDRSCIDEGGGASEDGPVVEHLRQDGHGEQTSGTGPVGCLLPGAGGTGVHLPEGFRRSAASASRGKYAGQHGRNRISGHEMFRMARTGGASS